MKNFSLLLPEKTPSVARTKVTKRSACVESGHPSPTSLSFTPRLCPSLYGRTVYSVWIGRSYCETRPGFPHSARPRFVVPGEALKPPGLRWHCPRPPGDSAQACSLSSTPAAISQPPPSSRPSAFSAARLPSPRYGFARCAPLRSASRRLASPRDASRNFAVPNFSSRIPRPRPPIAFLAPSSLSIPFSYRRFCVSYAATRLRNCYSSRKHGQISRFLHDIVISLTPPRRRAGD